MVLLFKSKQNMITSTEQCIPLLPKLSDCICFSAMQRTHFKWEKPVKPVNSGKVLQQSLTDWCDATSDGTYYR